MNLGSQSKGCISKGSNMKDKIGLQGTYQVEHWRKGKKIATYNFNNGITNVGKDHVLDTVFHGSAQIATWHVGLIDNASFSALAAADTMASHAGWIECVTYDEATRVEWTEGAASSQSITNATALTFTQNATKTINGIFITSDNTKSGTSGTLFSTASFSSTVAVVDDDQLKVTYTVSA